MVAGNLRNKKENNRTTIISKINKGPKKPSAKTVTNKPEE